MKLSISGRIGRRLAALGLALALACTAIPFAGAVTQEDIDAMKQQKANLQSQMNSVQSQLDALAAKENSALEQALLYQQQMGLLTEQISETQAIIADYEVQIAETQADLEEAREKVEQYYILFCERVRDMEENEGVSYWSILFDAASFSDLLDRLNFIKEVVTYDNNVVDALEAARQAVADAEAQLEEEKAGQEAALADLEEEEAAIQEASDKNDALIAEIQANQDIYAAQLAEQAKALSDLDQDIVASEAEYQAQLEALRRQAEEEARQRQEEEQRRREEEQRRQEEEERRRQEEENNNSTPSDDSSSDNNSSNNNSSDNSSTPGGSSSSDTPSSTVPSSSIGSSVASYACQFIGNPYVWGGTSLTNGADCSGFVQAVYAHFGVSLSHSSWAQGASGTAVSYANAEPGDIIFYQSAASATGGHVGIYIGNGQMVNASSPSTGICISSVNPNRSGFTVRRIL